MQAQNNTIQGGMIGNFINIYQQEGTRGLWKVSLKMDPADLVLHFFLFLILFFLCPSFYLIQME